VRGITVSSRELQCYFPQDDMEDDKRLRLSSLAMVISNMENKKKKKHLFALLWFPKPQPGLGLHWLRAVKMSM